MRRTPIVLVPSAYAIELLRDAGGGAGRKGRPARRMPNATSDRVRQRTNVVEGIVSKRRNSSYRSGRSLDWIKSKNPAAPAVKREAEEDWGR